MGIKKEIIKKNVLACLIYMVITFLLSFLLVKEHRTIVFPILFSVIAGIHFMVVGVLMAINHINLDKEKRNGYMIAFAIIWSLILLSQFVNFI